MGSSSPPPPPPPSPPPPDPETKRRKKEDEQGRIRRSGSGQAIPSLGKAGAAPVKKKTLLGG